MSTCVAEEQLQRFLHKVEQLNALVALIDADPQLRARLAGCDTHQQVVDFASTLGLEIGRRWGESDPPAASEQRNLLASNPPPVGTEADRGAAGERRAEAGTHSFLRSEHS